MFNVPFRLSLTELISNLDISGIAPLSDILETITLKESTIALGIAIVVDERDISRIIPINISIYYNALSVELYVTIRLSPA